jgi:hypothetical protein
MYNKAAKESAANYSCNFDRKDAFNQDFGSQPVLNKTVTSMQMSQNYNIMDVKTPTNNFSIESSHSNRPERTTFNESWNNDKNQKAYKNRGQIIKTKPSSKDKKRKQLTKKKSQEMSKPVTAKSKPKVGGLLPPINKQDTQINKNKQVLKQKSVVAG